MRVRSNSSSSSSSRSVSANSQHSTVSGATLSLQSTHISQSWPGCKADVFTLHMHWRETPTASETVRQSVAYSHMALWYSPTLPMAGIPVGPMVYCCLCQSVSQVAKHNGQRSGNCCFDLFQVFK